LMHVLIENGQRQAVALPETAVQSQSDQSFVYVIARQGGRTVARQTPVTVGANENGFVEIREGLPVGVQVVLDGLDRVEPDVGVLAVQLFDAVPDGVALIFGPLFGSVAIGDLGRFFVLFLRHLTFGSLHRNMV